MIWVLMFLGASISATMGLIYVINSIARYKIIKNKIYATLIVVFLFVLFLITLSWINALAIAIYTAAFFLLFGILEKALYKLFGYKSNYNWVSTLALCASALFLVHGYYLCNSVVPTRYEFTTDKKMPDLKIAMFADSHIGTTFDGDGFVKHLETIKKEAPDILLIPGDFVDDGSKKADMEIACKALGELKLKYGVWFSYGNHDDGYFNHRDFTETDLRNSLLDNGINILEDASNLIDNKFYVVGRLDSNATNNNRETIKSLLQPLNKDKYIIVLDHEPNDYEEEAETKADLVLSGHTHGGQMIPITYFGQWVGVNDSTYGHKKINDTNFVVTSGISDWALKFKTGTRSEYVIIDVDAK